MDEQNENVKMKNLKLLVTLGCNIHLVSFSTGNIKSIKIEKYAKWVNIYDKTSFVLFVVCTDKTYKVKGYYIENCKGS